MEYEGFKLCKYCECLIDVDDEDAYLVDDDGNFFCCEEHYDLFCLGEWEEEEAWGD